VDGSEVEERECSGLLSLDSVQGGPSLGEAYAPGTSANDVTPDKDGKKQDPREGRLSEKANRWKSNKKGKPSM